MDEMKPLLEPFCGEKLEDFPVLEKISVSPREIELDEYDLKMAAKYREESFRS